MEETSKLDALDKIEKTAPKSIYEGIDLTKQENFLGWLDIDRSAISYGGRLYPKSWKFQVKPAKVKEIRHFSAIDESNPISVTDSLNQMIMSNVRILDGNTVIPSSNLYEHDRFQFILFIHAYSGTATAIKYAHKCSNCDNELEVSLTPFVLRFKELSETATKYLTSSGKFEISTKSFGKKIYQPITIDMSTKIKDFVTEKYRTDDDYERNFIKLLPFIYVQNKSLAEIYVDKYLSLSEKEYSVLYTLADKHFDIGAKNEISVECNKCNNGGVAPIKFPNGIRSIFINDDISDELI